MVPTVSARLVDDEAAAVTEVLRPWRQNFATVEVTEDFRSGKPADCLSSRPQRLSDGGPSRPPLGADAGPVTHAVLTAPPPPVAAAGHE
ncbi:hypothetical protein ACFRU3_32870 [Streptomyces sp. NPDC056910]|uniref:hypothetical protein n=1 Tax=Streptomyces sp. NPDC056910 TaxID=3345964 RepID=UPI0036D1C407